MNILKKLKHKIEFKIEDIKYYFESQKCKRLYLDYEDNAYNCGSLKFIWGITSHDELTSETANLYTMNDIDITYDRKTKEYILGVETAYMFEGNRKQGECEYLKRLLELFTKLMDDNDYSKEFDMCLFMIEPSISMSAETIEELYVKFKIYADGYCSVYGY